MIDTHTHIYEPEFDSDRQEMVRRALEAGVTQFILPNIDLDSIGRMHTFRNQYPEYCRMAMGLHPSSVNAGYKSSLKQIEQHLAEQTYCAVGEIGIDLYWDKTFIQEQLVAFEIQLHWAAELRIPVIIHVREAQDEVLSVIQKCAGPHLRGVFHSFGGTAEEAKRISGYGDFYFGINGIVTFKNSGLKEALPHLGPDRILLETDAPYLTPVPYRGKRNEPAYLPYIAHAIADTLKIDFEEVNRRTTDNTIRLFGIG